MNDRKGSLAGRLQEWKLKKQPIIQNHNSKFLQVRNQNKTPLSQTKENIASTENKLRSQKKDSKILSKDRKSSANENTSSQNLREQLEKWRESTGRNKSDTTNRLLSRKRALLGFESNHTRPKKIRKRSSNVSEKNADDKTKEHGFNEETCETTVNENQGEQDESCDKQERIPGYTHVGSEIKTPRTPACETPSRGGRKPSAIRSQFRTPRDRKTISFTPLQPKSSAMKHSALNSAPQRRSISTIRCHQNQSLTPYTKIKSLPDKSVLKSAPSRRTMSTIKVYENRTTTTPFQRNTCRFAGSVLSEKPRRRTFAGSCQDNAPPVIAPFTPRGEWQNEDLSIRERLDIWLSVRGRTVNKPYVIFRKTPARRKSASKTSTTDHEDIKEELNRTFTFEDSFEEKTDDKVSKDKHPKMNEIERNVTEESIKHILERINKESELDAIKDELDLILSTSPGVVKLAAYWVARARLSAKSESIERVICLLEQANAFDAEPQDMIKDEICDYLEKLKVEDTHKNEEFPDACVYNEDIPNPGRTPAKRVKFIDTQRHLAFNSSLIKFCLLECTPFKRRLKSTLAKQILTPVRRSGRIEKVQSKLPSILRNHVPTASSPSEFTNGNNDGDLYFLPNLNLQSKLNDLWEEKELDGNNKRQQINQDLSF